MINCSRYVASSFWSPTKVSFPLFSPSSAITTLCASGRVAYAGLVQNARSFSLQQVDWGEHFTIHPQLNTLDDQKPIPPAGVPQAERRGSGCLAAGLLTGGLAAPGGEPRTGVGSCCRLTASKCLLSCLFNCKRIQEKFFKDYMTKKRLAH